MVRYYSPVLRTQIYAHHVGGGSSSNSPVTSYFTDEFNDSSLATSAGVLECSPLYKTLAELNMRVNMEVGRMPQDPDSQTSTSSAAIDRSLPPAYSSMISSQEPHTPGPTESQPEVPPPLEMGLAEPWGEIPSSPPPTSFESQSLLFGGNPPQWCHRKELRETLTYVIADFTVSSQKRVLDYSAEDDPEGDEPGSPHKRPRQHQAIGAVAPYGTYDESEYNGEGDDEHWELPSPIIQDSEIYQCPRCSKLFSRQSALARHRRSISSILLRCLDLSAGPLKVYICSEPGCKGSFARRDVMAKHVRRAHNHGYTNATSKRYTVEELQALMENQAQSCENCE